jgi:tRNA pseudouridine55 synthase
MAKKKNKSESKFHGIVLVDKPPGVTSHDVVDRVRRIFGTRAVGHTGTLDPQATGLLVMLVGEATRVSEYLVGTDKTYEGTIRFGVVSDTYDADGKVEPGPGGAVPTVLETVQAAAAEFNGEIDQVPPPYSAKKVAGRKLYEYAREGAVPVVEPRRVRIGEFEILNLADGVSEFGVDCSSGTYVRSLVHELGQKLGCGAILTELRRTDVGLFQIENARTLEVLESLQGDHALRETIVPLQVALAKLPTVHIGPTAESWLRRGQPIPHNMVSTPDDWRPGRGSQVVLVRLTGEAVAIAKVEPAPASPPPRAMANAVAPWYHPIKQFDIPHFDEFAEDEAEEDGE